MKVVTLARKPMVGAVAETVVEHGCGALNVDACRIHSGPSSGGSISGSTALGQGSGWNAHNNRTTQIDRSMAAGRWPSNMILQGEVVVASLGGQSGESHERLRVTGRDEGRVDETQWRFKPTEGTLRGHGDGGTAARYFKQIGID